MPGSRHATALILALTLLTVPAPGSGPGKVVWTDPDGQPLPFDSEDEVLEFLSRAEVVSVRPVGEGVNRIKKILLGERDLRLNAAFREVDIRRRKIRLGHRIVHHFRDSYLFECAAYELSRLLGINHVPPTVRRRIRGKEGTLQAWVELATSERDRVEKKLAAPEPRRWQLEMQLVYLFDNLIFNDDRNQGNLLYDPNWRIWAIDHGRAFRRQRQLLNPGVVRHVEEGVWERLRGGDQRQIRSLLKPYLSRVEINTLWQRWQALITHLEKQIGRRGREAVLWSRSEFGPRLSSE